MTILLPTTLSMTAAAVLINFWLGMRIGKLRHAYKVSAGDGGNEHLMRRMRAQANFIEQTPLTLILIGAIEFTGRGGLWLPWVAAAFMAGRVAHAFGMESDTSFRAGRPIGMLTSLLPQLGLAAFAVGLAVGKF